MGLMEGLGYIPISPAHPQKENRFILSGWGVELRDLGYRIGLVYHYHRGKKIDLRMKTPPTVNSKKCLSLVT